MSYKVTLQNDFGLVCIAHNCRNKDDTYNRLGDMLDNMGFEHPETDQSDFEIIQIEEEQND